MHPTLRVRRLRKTFVLHTIDGRTVHSLHGVDLDVAAGEHVALVGPSGAGKSSLLRCVYRTYLPDSGSVVLHTDSDPIELTTLPDRTLARLRGRQIGYVAQFLTAPPRTSAPVRGHRQDRRLPGRPCRPLLLVDIGLPHTELLAGVVFLIGIPLTLVLREPLGRALN